MANIPETGAVTGNSIEVINRTSVSKSQIEERKKMLEGDVKRITEELEVLSVMLEKINKYAQK